MEKPLKLRFHIISPVHIGCDDVYEPTSFVIDEKNGKLIVFDQVDFIKGLSPKDKERFVSICMQGNISSIIGIYKFLSNRQIKGREVEMVAGLLPDYKRVRDLPINDEKRIKRELNQFTISRTAYHPYDNLPYIPGSSVKGAIRTAWLNKIAKERGIKEWWKVSKAKEGRQSKELEEKLLNGSFDTDPFRMVKVSDFTALGAAKTRIVYAVNKKKKTSKFEARGPYQILETIKEGSVFEGVINIEKLSDMSGIKEPIAIKELLKSVNSFYIPAVNEEGKVTTTIEAGSFVAKRINEKFKEKMGKDAFLIRIGRHSGAEAVTIEGNRNIKIMQAGGEFKFDNHATTIWLASETSNPTTNRGLIPFGWSVLEIVN
jgi:CRISPR-associated protein Csm5